MNYVRASVSLSGKSPGGNGLMGERWERRVTRNRTLLLWTARGADAMIAASRRPRSLRCHYAALK